MGADITGVTPLTPALSPWEGVRKRMRLERESAHAR